MSNTTTRYCIDANVLIQAWQNYYSPILCPSYWDKLNFLGESGVIFMPEIVYEEITRTDDELSNWLKQSKIPIHKIDEEVTVCLKNIYETNPNHKFLSDNTKGRSLADPWLIAHAIKEQATVVTKENIVRGGKPSTIKIPNVCENMGVTYVNDFEFLKEINVLFSCSVNSPSYENQPSV